MCVSTCVKSTTLDDLDGQKALYYTNYATFGAHCKKLKE